MKETPLAQVDEALPERSRQKPFLFSELLVFVVLVALLVPALGAPAVGLFELLASIGERSAPPGALPFELVLVPATDGLLRICKWLFVPGMASIVIYEWRSLARAKRGELASPGA